MDMKAPLLHFCMLWAKMEKGPGDEDFPRRPRIALMFKLFLVDKISQIA